MRRGKGKKWEPRLARREKKIRRKEEGWLDREEKKRKKNVRGMHESDGSVYVLCKEEKKGRGGVVG